MHFTRAWLTDAAERVVRAFLVAFLGQYLASQTGIYSVNTAKAAAAAGIASALSILVSLLGASTSNGVSPASVVGSGPKDQRGYGVVEVLLIVVLILVILFLIGVLR